MENKLKFYRFYGSRSMRIEAVPIDGDCYRVFVIGDYIPAREGVIVATDTMFSFAETEVTNWMAVVKPIVDRIFTIP